jgi:hypothetical protein
MDEEGKKKGGRVGSVVQRDERGGKEEDGGGGGQTHTNTFAPPLGSWLSFLSISPPAFSN